MAAIQAALADVAAKRTKPARAALKSLAKKLGGTPLPHADAAKLVEALAQAMHYAHQRGIVHRDLKPANILLTADGTPKITDFGLAKFVIGGGGEQTHSGSILGTPNYMSPEQAEGRTHEAGPPADIYALGAILYEMLTGRPPFQAATPVDTLLLVLDQDPVRPVAHPSPQQMRGQGEGSGGRDTLFIRRPGSLPSARARGRAAGRGSRSRAARW